jgi:hypothetical protein
VRSVLTRREMNYAPAAREKVARNVIGMRREAKLRELGQDRTCVPDMPFGMEAGDPSSSARVGSPTVHQAQLVNRPGHA